MKRSGRAQRKMARQAALAANQKEKEDIFEVPEHGMTVEELADHLAVSPAEVVKTLFMKGVMAQVNQTLDRDAVKLVGEEFDVEVLDIDAPSLEDMAKKTTEFLDEDDIDGLEPRPPVVTIMGHVDHGKTSLLDYIRNTKVAAGEAGGITQKIGAYTIAVSTEAEEEKKITFLDTPGHEAFSAMRARGARVTDIAVIIVAADDGVRPQTLEAVAHAKAAGVPIVVAINKCDKDSADVERVKAEMSSQADLLPEEWGGDVPMVPVSARTGAGVNELLETIALMAEISDIFAQPDKLAAGTIIEAHLDRSRGPVATVLVQNGTLSIGDNLVAGAAFGKVRAMSNGLQPLTSAAPSYAVEILGLNMVPVAGDEFTVVEQESEARAAAEFAAEKLRHKRLAEQSGGGSRVTLSTIASMDEMDDVEALQRFNIILKADASGTLEAVKSALLQLPQDSVMLRFLLTAAGDINSSDLDLADASEGMIVGFNIGVSEAVSAEAKRRGIEVRTYSVIYGLLDEMRAAMEGKLAPVSEKDVMGSAVVKAVFGSGTKRVVAGCSVEQGIITNDCQLVINRGKKELWEGPIQSLRRVKDDVASVEAPLECGLQCDFKDWKEGDVITAFKYVSKTRTLEEAKATSVTGLEMSSM